MIKRLRLERFKNFKDATLDLGPLTLLVGANASGKSNLRDAFRFLHGLSRGYTLAEIIGEKWVEGAFLQWTGLRGGTRETAYCGASSFAIEAHVDVRGEPLGYRIEVDVGANGSPPRVNSESLYLGQEMIFDSHPNEDAPAQTSRDLLAVHTPQIVKNSKHGPTLHFSSKPVLTQIGTRMPRRKSDSSFYVHADMQPHAKDAVFNTTDALSSMRFLDLNPDAMRIPSLAGQEILGDRGENLSSVLQAICAKPETKQAVIEWVRELTPLDVTDFEFVPDQTGKILVSFIEASGQKTSAYSASDGTLRFLSMIAALLGPTPSQFYFFEELENGIHPTRLHLLLQLIEQRVSTGEIQMVASSHSPQLLGFLSPRARQDAVVVYRPADAPDARIRRIAELPDAERLMREQDVAQLHASGWLEDAVAFDNAREEGQG